MRYRRHFSFSPVGGLITKSHAVNLLGSQTGDISGDTAAGEYIGRIDDNACGRAVRTVDGHDWVDRQGRSWDGDLRHGG